MTEPHGQRAKSTLNQRALEGYRERFSRSSSGAAEFLQFLRRSEVSAWRFERDSNNPSRWWINVTLPSHQQEIFGLNREIQVLYTEYERVEPRVLSIIQSRVRKDMRVEPDMAILVSRDRNVKYTAARRAGEMAIVTVDLNRIYSDDPRPLHAFIAQSAATVDHYDVTTPVRDPSGFYGRHAEIELIAYNLKRAISVGIFGLRKAGKTSLLNSLVALRVDDECSATVRVDVSEIVSAEQFRTAILEGTWKSVRALPGNEGMNPRLRTLTTRGTRRTDVLDSAPAWIQDLRVILENSERPTVLIVDEIDQAFPPRSNLDQTEARGLFSSLAQLRSLLQEQDRLALLCAGVDPSLFEQPLVNGKDNLLYKLVRLVWLAPMSRDEIAEMVRSLGKRMGVRLRDHQVIDLLFHTYGGHPLLTRKACSIAVRKRTTESLPFHITSEILADAIVLREYGGPRDQAADVVTSFTEWFPEESALLRMYFSPDLEERDFARSILIENPDGLLHSVAYGLCFQDHTARISAAIEYLER